MEDVWYGWFLPMILVTAIVKVFKIPDDFLYLAAIPVVNAIVFVGMFFFGFFWCIAHFANMWAHLMGAA